MTLRSLTATRVFGAAFALLLTSATAAAQEPGQRELTPDERARELYLRGDRLYAEGSYDDAIVALKEAYELSHRPALLYDIANAFERLGRYEEALHYLNQYAPSAPEHQRHIVLKRIRSLEQRSEGRRQQDSSTGVRPTAPPMVAAPSAVNATTAAANEDVGPSPPYLGYAIGGTGLLGIGAGVVLGLSAASARDDAQGQCVDNGSALLCPVSARDGLSSAKNRALAADIAWGLGIAAVGVGVYLVLDSGTESSGTTQLHSTASPSGAGVSLVRTF